MPTVVASIRRRDAIRTSAADEDRMVVLWSGRAATALA